MTESTSLDAKDIDFAADKDEMMDLSQNMLQLFLQEKYNIKAISNKPNQHNKTDDADDDDDDQQDTDQTTTNKESDPLSKEQQLALKFSMFTLNNLDKVRRHSTTRDYPFS